jgi:hypothetical protein
MTSCCGSDPFTFCCSRDRMSHQDDMGELFDGLEDLTPIQRRAIKERYCFLMSDYRRRCRTYTMLFYAFKLTMTVGSLAVPALLTIQNNTNGAAMYWLTWGLSLAVTTANGITTLFKLDKRFFVLHATMERLRTETWQFIELSGRYSGHHGTTKPTHKNQYVYYCSQIEKIHMKQIDEEFIKNADMDQAHPPAASTSGLPRTKTLTGGDMVPSPADQAGLGSPSSSKPRRESQSTLGSDDTVIEIDSKPNKKKEEVLTLKEPSQDVSESTVRLRTPLQSGQVQQSADSVNA